MDNFLLPIANSLGVSVNILGVIIGIIFVLMVSFFTYYSTGSIVFTSISQMLSIFLLIYLGLMSLWMIFPALIFTVVCIVARSFSPKHPEGEGSKWDDYGRDIKLAYASKFGGENLGFNQEIDIRINIMNNNGKGFTRSIAYDWLKRMRKFTECK